jgi:uncharacterized protein (DUF1800 family)
LRARKSVHRKTPAASPFQRENASASPGSSRGSRPSHKARSTHAAGHHAASHPGIPTYTGPFTTTHAERLLWRAGFGPKPGQARRLAKLGMRGAVLSLTRPKRQALVGPEPVLETGQPIQPYTLWGNEVLWWLDRMVRTTAPLIERMTLTWHDWFATSNEGVGSPALMIAQNETMRRLCLGTFPKLLEAVTIDPAMLVYLSGATSTKDAPNENYAREMQELFVLGAGSGYTEQDVREHARALTGWTCSWNAQTNQLDDFRLEPELQDKGEKVIYGKRGRFEWQDSIDLVIEHPAHPKHFVTKLWSYFSEAPLPSHQVRAFEDLYESSGKEIRPVVEAMLMHPLFHSGPRMVKPPIVQIAGMLRAIGRYIDTDAWVWESQSAGQMPFYPPNVAGWEASRWLNTATWASRFNLTASIIDERRAVNPNGKVKVTSEPKELVKEATGFWGSPTLSGATHAALVSYAKAAVDSASAQWEQEAYPALTLNALRALVVSTPDYHTC